jgi:hypothetical protein
MGIGFAMKSLKATLGFRNSENAVLFLEKLIKPRFFVVKV